MAIDGLTRDGQTPREFQEAWPSSAIREYLHEKSPQDIFAVFDAGGFGMIDLPDNYRDGHVLPNLTTQQLFANAGNHNQVPVILGSNRDEPTLFMTRDPRYVDNFLGIFYWLKDEDTYRRLVHYGARAWKANGVDELALAMAASGNPACTPTVSTGTRNPACWATISASPWARPTPLRSASYSGSSTGSDWAISIPTTRTSAAVGKYDVLLDGVRPHRRPGQGPRWHRNAVARLGTDGKSSIIFDTPTDGGIRMDDEVVTYRAIKAELVADTGFADKSLHCATYVRVFRRTELFDNAEYTALGCADYPPESISWF